MTRGNLTREQAIALVGPKFVDKLDREGCDYTGRVQTDGDDRVEFAASVRLPEDHDYYTLTAYYYQNPADLQGVEDLSDLPWEIAGYECI